MSKPNQEVEDYLKDLALTDFKSFLDVTGVDVEKIAVCMERARGLSWAQIAQKRGRSVGSVRHAAKNCDTCSSMLKK